MTGWGTCGHRAWVPRGWGTAGLSAGGSCWAGPQRSSLLAPMKPQPPARYSERLAPRQPVPITPAGHFPRLEESCVLTREQGQQAGIGPEGYKDCKPSTPAWTEGLPRGGVPGSPAGRPPVSFRPLGCWSASQHTAKPFRPSGSSTQTARNYTSWV